MAGIKRISEIEVNNGQVSFKCTSELYGVTDAAGAVDNVVKSGFISLGDGCDYKIGLSEKSEIVRLHTKFLGCI